VSTVSLVAIYFLKNY